MNIKIMSFNTQHCNNFVTNRIDFDAVADAIRQCDADVVGLQEIRGAGVAEGYDAQTEILAEKLGYHYYFARAIFVRGNNPYGNAILSRYPILSAETVMIPDPVVRLPEGTAYETRCILKATVDVGGGLNVLATHFGLNPDEQQNAVETVVSHLSGERCVLLGDFNVQPDNPVLAPIKERLYDTANDFSAPKLSFPSDKPRIKIDYMFVTKDLKVQSADIPAMIVSDHRPYIISVEI